MKRHKVAEKKAPEPKDVFPVKVAVFTKDQILRSERYRDHRDLLMFLLEDGEARYSHDLVGSILDDFLKKEVK